MKILGLFKKGSKAVSKAGKKGGDKAAAWPSGTKIGVYGHTNSGKTVYFTVLNEESKMGRDLQLSITDDATAGEILSNYRNIWGVATEMGTGTMVDTRGEKKFPEPTTDEIPLQFNAIIDGEDKIPIVVLDYNGKAVSITETGELKERVNGYMLQADGIMFFYDPKILGAELETKAHVSSFIGMLEKLAPLKKKLHIPVSLVITKADILPGFSGDDQTVLVSSENESWLSENFDAFQDMVLSSNKIASNSAWAGSVRNILFNLRDFLKVVVGRTLNFQIFFISNTGSTPEKIGADVGRSIYAPPARIRPVGVKAPLYWMINTIRRAKRVRGLKRFTKVVATLSIIWMILVSIPYLWNTVWLLPRTIHIEDSVLASANGNFYNTTTKDRSLVKDAWRKYSQSWIISNIFPKFKNPADRIRTRYEEFNLAEALEQLDLTIIRFTAVVKDTSLWPKMNPSDKSLLMTKEHTSIEDELNNFHAGDDNTELFRRSGRALTYWELYKNSILNPADTSTWETIRQQVLQDQNLYVAEISNAEKGLGQALMTGQKVTKEKVVAQKAGVEFDNVIENVNGNSDPDYRINKAVRELRQIRGQLNPELQGNEMAMIDRYINAAKAFDERRKFSVRIQKLPDQDHVHIEVVTKGKDPGWGEISQYFEGDEIEIWWKKGYEIHIAYDLVTDQCAWGKTASDRKVFDSELSIFDLNGEIRFSNVNKSISIRMKPDPRELLPKLE